MITTTLTALNDNILRGFSISLLINLMDKIIQNFPGTYLKDEVISALTSTLCNGYQVV